MSECLIQKIIEKKNNRRSKCFLYEKWRFDSELEMFWTFGMNVHTLFQTFIVQNVRSLESNVTFSNKKHLDFGLFFLVFIGAFTEIFCVDFNWSSQLSTKILWCDFFEKVHFLDSKTAKKKSNIIGQVLASFYTLFEFWKSKKLPNVECNMTKIDLVV